MVEKTVTLINVEKTKQKDILLDPAGFFVIEIDRKEKKIRVEYFLNVYKDKKIVSGNLQKVFIGKKADALSYTIVKNVPKLLPEHYMYLGRELLSAQYALEKNKKYVQGGC
jgi:hypothetical protein